MLQESTTFTNWWEKWRFTTDSVHFMNNTLGVRTKKIKFTLDGVPHYTIAVTNWINRDQSIVVPQDLRHSLLITVTGGKMVQKPYPVAAKITTSWLQSWGTSITHPGWTSSKRELESACSLNYFPRSRHPSWLIILCDQWVTSCFLFVLFFHGLPSTPFLPGRFICSVCFCHQFNLIKCFQKCPPGKNLEAIKFASE